MTRRATATQRPPLPIRLLGELQVGPPEAQRVLPASRKTRALLAYLAVSARTRRRSELCSLFWEDAADPRAALRWSLTQLRQALGDDYRELICADRSSVGLKDQGIATDLDRLKALTRDPSPADHDLDSTPRKDLLAASALFHGEFLEGLDLPSCYAYHEWCMAEREGASRLREQVLVALIEHDQNRPELVLAHGRALVALNPLNEWGHVRLMRALATLGRSADARAQHAQCRRIFETELGMAPPAELDAALAALDKGPASRPDEGAVVAGPALAPPVGQASRAPLIGREEERKQIETLIACCNNRQPSEILLLSGVPGIGKSRLLDEVERRVAAAGGRSLRGRAFEVERLRPYGIWIDAFRGLWTDELPPQLHQDLKPLLHPGAAGFDGAERERLFDAARDALSHLARQGPLALLVDDLQWIEDSSAALLHYVMRQLASIGVMFVLAARGGELEDSACAQQLVAALAKDRRLRRMALGPLSDAQAFELVSGAGRGEEAQRIIGLGQGHPMLLLELARAGDVPGASTELSDHIRSTRLASLSPGAADLLGWAAAFGRDFALDALMAAQRADAGSASSALAELERHDLILASGDADYRFSHDLIHEASYRSLSQPRRRLMHKAIALSLGRELEHDPAVGAEVARHAGLGGQHALAARASVSAGEHALRMTANREAAELARRGRASAARVVDRAQRAKLDMDLLRVLVLATSSPTLARLRPDAAAIEQAVGDAERCRLHEEVAQGHYLLSVLHQDAGRIDDAGEATLRAAQAAERSSGLIRARQLANSARCLVELGRDIDHARDLVAQARQFADTAGLHETEVRWCLGLLHRWDGEAGLALQEIDCAAELAADQEDRWRQGRCLAAAALIELERGASGPALQRARALGEVAGRSGDAADTALAVALAALASRMAGEDQPSLGPALEALRAADDKAQLAAVLNLAADIDWGRRDLGAAEALAVEALSLAQLIGEQTETLVARALLAKLSIEAGDAPGWQRAALHLQPALDAPQHFSARAGRAAADALRFSARIPTGHQQPAP